MINIKDTKTKKALKMSAFSLFKKLYDVN